MSISISHGPPHPPLAGEPARVLVVDRDKAFRSTTAGRLCGEGCRCETAGDCEEATAKLTAAEYDVVIVGADGPGTVNLPWAVRARRLVDGLSVIAVTGEWPAPPTVETFRSLLAAWLVKPIDFAQLVEHVRTAAGYTRAHRSACRQCADAGGRARHGVPSPVVRWPRPGPIDASMTRITDSVQRSLSTLQRLTDLLTVEAGEADQTYLGAPARLTNARGLVREAAQVLQQSRRAFHSDRLDQLRHKLQILLDNWKDGET